MCNIWRITGADKIVWRSLKWKRSMACKGGLKIGPPLLVFNHLFLVLNTTPVHLKPQKTPERLQLTRHATSLMICDEAQTRTLSVLKTLCYPLLHRDTLYHSPTAKMQQKFYVFTQKQCRVKEAKNRTVNSSWYLKWSSMKDKKKRSSATPHLLRSLNWWTRQ